MSMPNLDPVAQEVADSGADQRYIAVVGPLRARTAVLRLLGTLDPTCSYAPLVFAGLLPSDSAVGGQGSAEAATCCGRDVAPDLEKPYAARSGTLLVAAENLCAVATAVDVRALRAVVVAVDVALGRHVAGACQRPALPDGCAVALVLVAVVIDGDGSASESDDAAACAGLQVAVRRAALERMGGCSVVIMRDHTSVTGAADINVGESRVHGDPGKPVPEARKLWMRRALESLVAGAHGAPLDDELVGIHAGGDLCCFSAHAGWDSSSKIQAVLEASGVMDPPQLDISKDVDRALLANLALDSCEPQPDNGRESEDDDRFADGSTAQITELRPSKEEDVDEEDEDEETWLRRVAELCNARSKEIASKRPPITTPSNEPRTVPTRSSSSFVRRVSASGPKNGPSSSAPVRAAAPGSGAQFFQRMLRTEK